MQILKRELLTFSRNGGWLVAIIFPFVMIVTMGLALSGDVHGIPLGISGNSELVTALNEQFTEDSKFKVSFIDRPDINSLIVQGKLRGAIDTEISAVEPETATITIYIDSTDQQLKEQIKYLVTSHIYDKLSPIYGTFLEVEIVELYSEKNFFAYLGPGLLALSILTGGLFGAAETILHEKDTKTLENVILSGFSVTRYIAEKTLSFMISMLIISGLSLFLVLFFGTGLISYESMVAVVLLILLTEFVYVSLGLALSTLCPNEDVSGQIIAMVMLPMMFLSGAFVTIYQMNPIIIPIAQLNPLTSIIEALRGLMLKEALVADVLPVIGYLSIIGIGVFLLSICLMYSTISRIRK